jgi:acetyl esterase/lipase
MNPSPFSRRRFLGFAGMAAALGGASPRLRAAAAPAASVELQVLLDLEIHRVPTAKGTRMLTVDLWLPRRGTGKIPLVIYIHGGAWREGTQYRPPFRPRLFDHGIGIAAITYRFTHEAPFPAMLHDCKLAVRWLRAHAGTHGLDPARFALWGISAGGHLVSLMGLTDGDPTAEGDGPWREHTSRVRAVVNWCGPTDLVRTMTDPVPGAEMRTLVPQVIGGPIETHREVALAASPLHYARKHGMKRSPPMLIVHGAKDDIVPAYHATSFHEAMREAGADSELLLMPELGHALDHPTVAARTEAFLRRHLT